MKNLILKLTAGALLMSGSALALAAGNCCGDLVECCLQQLACCL